VHLEREFLFKADETDSELIALPSLGAIDARLGKANASSQVQAFVRDVKRVS
jgi:hypothetical protein